MEFAFINGVLRSKSAFPPQDPWLLGYAISYYYFGYVMLGLLSSSPELIRPSASIWVWRSVCVVMLVGVFGVAYDLAADWPRRCRCGQSRLPLLVGLAGLLFVGILGNLEALVELAYHRQLVPESWIRWLDIKQLTAAPPNPATGRNNSGGGGAPRA